MGRARDRLGLLVTFSALSVLVFTAAGLALSHILHGIVREGAQREAERSAATIAGQAAVHGLDRRDVVDQPDAETLAYFKELAHSTRTDGQLAAIKLWRRDGTVMWSDNREIIGRRFKIGDDLRTALGGEIASKVEHEEDDGSGTPGGALLEVYVPLSFGASRPYGAFELYLDYADIEAAAAADARRLSLALALALGAAYLVLLPIVWGASRRLRRQSEQNRHQALHDALTGLPNRTLLLDRLEHGIRAARRDGTALAVLLLDFDRFKEINDTLGHQSGDELLCRVAGRLRDRLRGGDTIARLGGDEFAVLLRDVAGRDAAARVAEELRAALTGPFALPAMTITIDASVGIALFPEHADNAEALLQRADVAMYAAKSRRAGTAVYERSHEQFDTEYLSLVEDLRGAIERGELEVHYQPKAMLATRRPVGAEALARWRHPRRGMVAPDVFIPMAEHIGMIHSLTLHVLGDALSQARAWAAEGLDVPVAVNLSVLNLLHPELPEEVARLLAEAEVGPETLILEVTESAIMTDPRRSIATLERLRQMGVGLSIDDFGVGHSSLAYISRLPVNEIKIDRSFMANVADVKADGAVVRSAIELARNLGLRVVAEGVEDEQAWSQLEELGCDIAQGYYLGRPAPAEELTAWLRDAGGARPTVGLGTFR